MAENLPPAAANCLPGDAAPAAITGPDEKGVFSALAATGSGGPGNRFVLADISPRTSPAEIAKTVQGETLWAWAAGKPNRWGLVPAWIVAAPQGTAGDTALQQIRLIDRGLAMAAPHFSSMACSKALIEAEHSARFAKRGRWQHEDALSTMNLNALTGAAGTYVLAEGRIVSLGKSAHTRYLNFGRNWKTDFTATLSTSQDKSFSDALAAAGMSLEDLAGHAVQIRGVVDLNDGPHIHMTHPGQLIILDGNEDRK
ncbi:hypothetical protein [Roseibium litorale]|uniref:Nuclease n=1 Tax=Roseibium litorale TaxID=2803841 RepID=A0ABR9CMZ9_9HYPH|nr:hypothetical protein [Roseibium litorale]MBD8892215.1 hypothetical protein [Roseibium litorale]